jgi:hypothetical protein
VRVFASLRSFASAVFHRSRVEDEMDAELRAHIQDRASDLERSGLPRAEAERRARLEFGGCQKYKEEIREARGVHYDCLLLDLGVLRVCVATRSAGFLQATREFYCPFQLTQERPTPSSI